MMILRQCIPIKFYSTPTGREPVRDWIIELNKKERKIIGADIRAVQLRWPIGLPLVGPFGEGLWEIRSKLDRRISRIIFCFYDDRLILLHVFIKKTPKTPQDDLMIAKKRYKEVKGK